jgi:RNase P/RNase MRP subunit POP5
VERIVKGNRRYRYIDFRVIIQGEAHSCTSSDILKAIRQNQKSFESDTETTLRLWIVRFDGVSGIIKCPRDAKDRLIHLLQSLEHIEGNPVHVITFSTSGTIRGLLQKK